MPYFVYILRSLKDGKHYIGSTSNIEARIIFHNSGKQRSTRHRIPFKLIHFEEFPNKHDSLIRERIIKSYKGGLALRKLVGEV